MKLDLQAFLPNRISGQIALIIVGSLAAIHGLLTVAFLLHRPEEIRSFPGNRLAVLIETVDAAPISDRAVLVAAMANSFPQFGPELVDRPPPGEGAAAGHEPSGLLHRLGPNFHGAMLAGGAAGGSAEQHRAVIGLSGEQSLVVTLTDPPLRPPFGPIETTVLAVAVSVTLLALWAARGLTGPLRRFAWAAESFSPDSDIALLPERGPYEIRLAAQALNRMRARIKRLLDERTQMLAAVSHDLRTPITRLRLNCEFIADPTVRTRMLNELDHMNTMLESVLHFLRNGQTHAAPTMIDLASSMQTICDRFADTGRDVVYQGPDHVVVRAHAEDLHRAITNLVDNAVRYGGRTEVRLGTRKSAVTIDVEDDGPGIAEVDKSAMLAPFVRCDAARGMNAGNGFGLGLAIARAVIEAHKGTLTLLDREPHGLLARVTLPCGGAMSDQEGAGEGGAKADAAP